MAETIKEFLVGLGYKVDGSSETKLKNSVEAITKQVAQLSVVLTGVAVATTAAVTKIARGFDEIYYMSQRTNASVQNIKAVGYAVSQLGGSYQSAVGSIEAFGQKLRSNPGYESLVRSLGVATQQNGRLRDTVEITKDLAKALSSKPYYVQLQYMEALGLDENTYRALQSGDLSRYLEEYRKKQEALGVNQEQAAKTGRDLSNAWRQLGLTVSTLGEKLMVDLGPHIERILKRFDDFLVANADKISQFFDKLADFVGKCVDAFIRLVEKGDGPIVEMFSKIEKSVDSLTLVLGAFATFLVGSWLVRILGAFGAVGAGFGGMLLKLGINPATIGLAAGMYPSTANGGEDEEIARRRANGTWGGANAFNGSNAIKDNRNWWQRTMPKWAGGKDAPNVGLSNGAIPGLSEQAASDYTNRLGRRESGNNYGQPGNQYGFRGRWQMGGPALADAGYVRRGTTNGGLADSSNWLGKDGLNSLQDFLANKDGGQDRAFAAYTAINHSRLKKAGIIRDDMSEEEVAGWLAVAHLKGIGGAKSLASGRDNVDGNGTSASSYFGMMKGIRTGAIPKSAPPSVPYAPFSGINAGSLAAIQSNAALFGAGIAPLTPPANNNSTNVEMKQETNITMLGGSDPAANGAAIANAQKGVNGGMLRNMQGAVR